MSKQLGMTILCTKHFFLLWHSRITRYTVWLWLFTCASSTTALINYQPPQRCKWIYISPEMQKIPGSKLPIACSSHKRYMVWIRHRRGVSKHLAWLRVSMCTLRLSVTPNVLRHLFYVLSIPCIFYENYMLWAACYQESFAFLGLCKFTCIVEGVDSLSVL